MSVGALFIPVTLAGLQFIGAQKNLWSAFREVMNSKQFCEAQDVATDMLIQRATNETGGLLRLPPPGRCMLSRKGICARRHQQGSNLRSVDIDPKVAAQLLNGTDIPTLKSIGKCLRP